jgi:hypothetical protein
MSLAGIQSVELLEISNEKHQEYISQSAHATWCPTEHYKVMLPQRDQKHVTNCSDLKDQGQQTAATRMKNDKEASRRNKIK